MPVKKTVATTEKTASTAKTTARKTTARAKTSTTKDKTPATKAAIQVDANAKHIQENTNEIKNNSKMLHLLYGIIIILMMVIAGLAFYVGQIMGNSNIPSTATTSIASAEDITITIIDDARCSDCQAGAIMQQLQVLPFLTGATFIQQDFSDNGVSDYITENNIVALPAVIFNTNSINDGGQITPYLSVLPDGQFSLALGATFDPFAKRSDKGFLTLDVSNVEAIKADSIIRGNSDAQITWIEYSDIQCPYCAQLHNNGTSETILEKYGEDVNIVFQHFPLDFHAQAQQGAEALECIAEQNPDVLYAVISQAYAAYPNQDITQVGLENIAADNGIDVDALIECRDSKKYAEKIQNQMSTGQNTFGITGTPGNVIVNNTTGEYEIISGAYPASAFEEIIDRMLAE